MRKMWLAALVAVLSVPAFGGEAKAWFFRKKAQAAPVACNTQQQQFTTVASGCAGQQFVPASFGQPQIGFPARSEFHGNFSIPLNSAYPANYVTTPSGIIYSSQQAPGTIYSSPNNPAPVITIPNALPMPQPTKTLPPILQPNTSGFYSAVEMKPGLVYIVGDDGTLRLAPEEWQKKIVK